MPSSESGGPGRPARERHPRACLVPGCERFATRAGRHRTDLEALGCFDPEGEWALCRVHHGMRDRMELFVSGPKADPTFWAADGRRILRARTALPLRHMARIEPVGLLPPSTSRRISRDGDAPPDRSRG
jgi:hypothetical protein